MEDVEGKGEDGMDEVFEVCFVGGLSRWTVESDEMRFCGQFCCFLTFSLFWTFWDVDKKIKPHNNHWIAHL